MTVEVNVQKLTELRINQGYSKRGLAKAAGLSGPAVYQIERRGSAMPATLKKLADVLGVKAVDLLEERKA